MILDLFKVGVYHKELSLDVDQLREYAIQYSYNTLSRTCSNVGGYQSPDIPLDNSFLSPLIKVINEECNIYANSIFLKDQYVSSAWLNINSYKDSNVSHAHPGCSLSGVFYIYAPDDCGNIVFENPAIDVIDSYWPEPNRYNEYNSSEWTLPAKQNYLYVFPSFLRHRVEPNLNQDLKRISLSFNMKMD